MHNRHQGWHQWTIFIRWPGISQLPGEFRPNSQDEPAVFAFQARSHWPKPRTKNMDYMYLKLVVAFLWNANPFAKWQIPAAWYCLVCLYIYIYIYVVSVCLLIWKSPEKYSNGWIDLNISMINFLLLEKKNPVIVPALELNGISRQLVNLSPNLVRHRAKSAQVSPAFVVKYQCFHTCKCRIQIKYFSARPSMASSEHYLSMSQCQYDNAGFTELRVFQWRIAGELGWDHCNLEVK